MLYLIRWRPSRQYRPDTASAYLPSRGKLRGTAGSIGSIIIGTRSKKTNPLRILGIFVHEAKEIIHVFY